MPRIWMYAGPPIGAGIYRVVIERLGEGEARYVLDVEHPEHGLDERAAAIASAVAASPEPVLLVAHGLAVPAVIAAAIRTPPAGVVLCNGPITRLDPITRSLAALTRVPGGRLALSRVVLHPALWLRYLASSAGLRRAVINPYVMDRDNVAALAGATVATQAARVAVTSYLRSLGEGLPDIRALTAPLWLVWGDADRLYPAYEADYARSALPGSTWFEVSGGQFAHPDERPWELAERVAAARDVVVGGPTRDPNVTIGHMGASV